MDALLEIKLLYFNTNIYEIPIKATIPRHFVLMAQIAYQFNAGVANDLNKHEWPLDINYKTNF